MAAVPPVVDAQGSGGDLDAAEQGGVGEGLPVAILEQGGGKLLGKRRVPSLAQASVRTRARVVAPQSDRHALAQIIRLGGTQSDLDEVIMPGDVVTTKKAIAAGTWRTFDSHFASTHEAVHAGRPSRCQHLVSGRVGERLDHFLEHPSGDRQARAPGIGRSAIFLLDLAHPDQKSDQRGVGESGDGVAGVHTEATHTGEIVTNGAGGDGANTVKVGCEADEVQRGGSP